VTVSVLSPAMRRLVNRQRLGFVGSVRGDGTPRVAAHGTLAAWDGETLVFADIAARGTVADLLENPAVEVAVVDPLLRKGWRFTGTARLLLSGPTFDRLTAFYRRRGVHAEVHHMVMVRVERAEPLISPVYAQGWSEAAVRQRWAAYYGMRPGKTARRAR
jgi:uncharacterized protein